MYRNNYHTYLNQKSLTFLRDSYLKKFVSNLVIRISLLLFKVKVKKEVI